MKIERLWLSSWFSPVQLFSICGNFTTKMIVSVQCNTRLKSYWFSSSKRRKKTYLFSFFHVSRQCYFRKIHSAVRLDRIVQWKKDIHLVWWKSHQREIIGIAWKLETFRESFNWSCKTKHIYIYDIKMYNKKSHKKCIKPLQNLK